MAIVTPYRLIRSDRRSISVSVAEDGSLTVRIPRRMSDREAARFLDENESRIKALIERERARRAAKPVYRDEDVDTLTEKALAVLPAKIEHYAALMGVRPTGCRITAAKKRFGSCSSKGRLCFSCFLMLYDEKAIDYVVVHELAHLREMNHSPRFYAIIQKILPDYKDREAILKGTV